MRTIPLLILSILLFQSCEYEAIKEVYPKSKLLVGVGGEPRGDLIKISFYTQKEYCQCENDLFEFTFNPLDYRQDEFFEIFSDCGKTNEIQIDYRNKTYKKAGFEMGDIQKLYIYIKEESLVFSIYFDDWKEETIIIGS